MTVWVQLAALLVTLASSIMTWLKDNNALKQAEAQFMAEHLQRVLDDVQKANTLRHDLDSIGFHGGLSDDPFRRTSDPDNAK